MLNIVPEDIIRSICKPYIETLDQEKSTSYIEDMKSAIGAALQKQIDQLESWCASIKILTQNTISSAAGWAAQIAAIATPDPSAPKAGAAVMVSLKNSVSEAKGEINMASSQLEEVTGTLDLWGLSYPNAISDISSLLTTCKTVLNAIPV